MQRKWAKNNRSGVLSRSHAHDGPYTAKYFISEIIGYLKRKSALIIFDRGTNLKYKYGNRAF